MASHQKTKWPRPPDPRPGHFGSRGFDPSYAMQWKYKLQCPGADPAYYPHLVNGIILPLDTETPPSDGYTSYALYYGLFLYSFYRFAVTHLQEPAATPAGYSVLWSIAFGFEDLTGHAYAEGQALWPSPSQNFPTLHLISVYPVAGIDYGPCTITGVPWNAVDGPV